MFLFGLSHMSYSNHIIKTPEYSLFLDHLVSWIKCIKHISISITDFIQPLCLPLPEYFPKLNLEPGRPFVVAGWGRTELGKF